MKKILYILFMTMPILSWGQMAEMTPERIFARKKIPNQYYINDSTVFYWNNNKGSFRAGFAKTDNIAPYADAFKEANIGQYSTAFGINNLATGQTSFSAGIKNITSATGAITLGAYNEASGGYAVGLGTNAKSSGLGSVALSNGNAKGDYSLAFSGGETVSAGSLAFHNGKTRNQGSLAVGEDVHATAWYASAIGYHLTSNSKYCLSVGQWSDSTINATGQDNALSPRFVVGTGYSSVNRINGFAVFQNGNAVHKAWVSVNTTNQPRASLDVVATDAIIVPVGTDAQRPTSPVLGMIRYNTSLNKYEGYTNTGWVALH